jgi:cyclopropane-fatty-acyl-phospholipid synthase
MGRRLMNIALQRILRSVGIAINGGNPWDLTVKDPRMFAEIFGRGSLGLGESYVKGWWDCEALDDFFYRLLKSHLDLLGFLNPVGVMRFLRDRFGKTATKKNAFEVGEKHYDLGNEFFRCMLDTRMAYSCAYWCGPDDDLEEAQRRKLDIVCRKLHLKAGERLLDVGCGWGSLAKYAAEHYATTVVGITVSKEQAAYAKETCHGLPVEIRLEDYRDVKGTYDRIASIGMFEHVERKNHDIFFAVIRRCLAPDGLFLLHTIGKRHDCGGSDPFMRKYIFPQGMIPVERLLRKTARKHFTVLDWHSFGSTRYDRTLVAWRQNFRDHWPTLEARYGGAMGGELRRMWEYYLSSCAGAFRARHLDVWQVVMAPGRVDYTMVR